MPMFKNWQIFVLLYLSIVRKDRFSTFSGYRRQDPVVSRQGDGQNQGQTQAQGRSQGQGLTQAQGRSQGYGQTQGRTQGYGQTQGQAQGYGQTQGQTQGQARTQDRRPPSPTPSTCSQMTQRNADETPRNRLTFLSDHVKLKLTIY